MLAGLASALGVKVFTVLGQVVAAHFLTPGDYGQVAPALSVAALVSVCAVGTWGVLLLRAPDDHQLRSAVFIAGTALSAVPILAVGALWFIARDASATRVAMLSLLLVVPIVLSPLTTVYSAHLQSNLKLKGLATLQFGEGVAATLALVVFSAVGAGPYAIAAAKGAAAAILLPCYRWLAEPLRIVRVPARSLLRVLGSGTNISAYLALATLVTTVPATIVGLAMNDVSAGLILWALQFALQLPVVLGSAARQVQMSVASSRRLTDDPGGWLNGIVPLAAAGLAIAVLQALLAPILIPMIFPQRWAGAILPVQYLSISQILLPLLTVQAGIALLAGDVRRVLVGTGFALVIVAVTSLAAVLYSRGDAASMAQYVAYGYLVAYLGNWIIVEALSRTISGRSAATCITLSALGCMLVYAFAEIANPSVSSTLWVGATWLIQGGAIAASIWAWREMLGGKGHVANAQERLRGETL